MNVGHLLLLLLGRDIDCPHQVFAVGHIATLDSYADVDVALGKGPSGLAAVAVADPKQLTEAEIVHHCSSSHVDNVPGLNACVSLVLYKGTNKAKP